MSKKVILFTTCLCLTALVASCSKQEKAKKGENKQESTSFKEQPGELKTFLGKNVTVKVLAVRSWEPPEPKFLLIEKIPEGRYYFFQMDRMPIGVTSPSPILEQEGQSVWTTVYATKAEFTRRCVRFASPKGQYVEILLLFENEGDTAFVESVTSTESQQLDIRLTLPDGAVVLPVDFLCPGLSNASLDHLKKLQEKGLTIVSEFTGNLGIYLDSGGRTWLLLLFDIPRGSQSVQLQIKNTRPIPIHLR